MANFCLNNWVHLRIFTAIRLIFALSPWPIIYFPFFKNCLPKIWQRCSFETFNDRVISHAVRIEEKEEKLYTLHMSLKYRYKRELNLTLQNLQDAIALGRILKNRGII